jgi:hypothetical protein
MISGGGGSAAGEARRRGSVAGRAGLDGRWAGDRRQGREDEVAGPVASRSRGRKGGGRRRSLIGH